MSVLVSSTTCPQLSFLIFFFDPSLDRANRVWLNSLAPTDLDEIDNQDP